MKFGNLNFLEPSGPLQACSGTAFLRTEDLNDLYSSPKIVRVIKSGRIKWAGHVVRMGERRGVYRVLVGRPVGKNHLEDPVVDGRIILRWIFRNWSVGVWTGWRWLKMGKVEGCCGCCNEPSGSVICGGYLEWLRTG